MYHATLAPKWKTGQSGNPSGRPKDAVSIAALAQRHGPEALATLLDLMRNSLDDAIRGRAAVAILDRGYGKPTQVLEEQLARPMPTAEERITMLQEIARRLGYSLEPMDGD